MMMSDAAYTTRTMTAHQDSRGNTAVPYCDPQVLFDAVRETNSALGAALECAGQIEQVLFGPQPIRGETPMNPRNGPPPLADVAAVNLDTARQLNERLQSIQKRIGQQS
jgi:hypothetical protein